MNRILANIRMELLSDVIFSSGNSIPGGADITLRTDGLGRPYVSGATIKGLLREALGNYLSWTNSGTDQDLDELLGCRGIRSVDSDRRLVFGDLRPEQRDLLEADCSYLRTFTEHENGVVKPGALHTALCMKRGMVLTGVIICAKDDTALVENSLRLIQSVGLKRNRGFGQVKITFRELEPIRPLNEVPAGNWIRYRLRLHTPMAITLGTSSPTDADRKNYSNSKDHIPGSAIRGLVMSHLSKNDPEWFAAHKQTLLRQVRFLNALPLIDGERQIPTPLGFYENREQTDFYHVLNRDVVSGHKRARMGRFCRISGEQLLHSSPAMESSLRITLTDPDTRLPLDGTERQMFTTEMLAADTMIEGSIYVPDPALTPRIAEAFQNWLCVGADRFGGSGLCSVELLDGQEPDNSAFSYRPDDPIPDTLCMLILSPTALMKDGEVTGLTDEDLASLLGVSHAKIERCATSIIQCSGFNRTWGCASPTVSMYAPGSIFLIHCSEAPSLERLRELELHGIGIRRNEGCGQILFPRGFFQIRSHVHANAGSPCVVRDTSDLILRRRARYRWLLNHRIDGKLSSAQIGSLQQLCENILLGKGTMVDLKLYFRHNLDRTTGFAGNYAILKRQIDDILETPLHKTLGCAPFDDTVLDRLQLFCDLCDMNRKGASR